MTLPNRLHSIFHPRTLVIILASCLLTQVAATVKSVLTYKQLSNQFSQLVTSSTLFWESYTGDPKQLEYAVHGGKYVTEDEHYPIYVCRAVIDGIFTSGHTEKRQQRVVCLVSMHMEVKTHHAYDVLINKGHGGKLNWTPWTKFSGKTPLGAISATGGHIEDSYVARHRVKHSEHHQTTNGEQDHYGADYNLGRFDPRDRLGKIIVSEGDREMEYENGEILTETEPVRYELREIKIDKWRSDIKVNNTFLGSAVLSNTDVVPTLVETVISYEYDKIQNWGAHDGVARGLPTKIYEGGRLSGEIQWGLKYTEKVIETKTVSTDLRPGTALNVTLNGNYTSLDAQYVATLVAYYADNDDSVSRKIVSNVQKYYMQDIKFEFSPVYWIENGTMLPTTTTTTTTTTEPTTTSTREPDPANAPPIVKVGDLSDSSSSSSSSSSGSGASVAESKKNPNDIGNSNESNFMNVDASLDGADSKNSQKASTAAAVEAGAGAASQQHQLISTLIGSCLIVSLLQLTSFTLN